MPGLRKPCVWGDGWSHNEYHWHDPIVDLILGECEGNDTSKLISVGDIDDASPAHRPKDLTFDEERKVWTLRIFLSKGTMLDDQRSPPQFAYGTTEVPDWFIRKIHAALFRDHDILRVEWSW